MTGRVQQHPPPVAARLVVGPDRAEPQRQLLRGVKVLPPKVEVELLRHVLTGPLRGPVSVDSLETGERLLERARAAGLVRAEARAGDMFALINAAVWVREQVPDEQGDRLLVFMLDGLRPVPAEGEWLARGLPPGSPPRVRRAGAAG